MVDVDDLQTKATDFVKKILTVGVGTIFLTEESLRALVSEFKLPKELLGGLIESAGKTKSEFVQSFSQEIVAQVMQRMDPKEFVEDFLAKHDIDLRIRISVKAKKPAQE